MSIYQVHKTRTARLNAMKLLLAVGAFAAVSSVTVISLEPTRMAPDADTAEAKSAMAGMAAHPLPKCWSDDWYEGQKFTPNNLSQDI